MRDILPYLPFITPIVTSLLIIFFGVFINRSIEHKKADLQKTLLFEIEPLKANLSRQNLNYGEYVKRQFIKVEDVFSTAYELSLAIISEWEPIRSLANPPFTEEGLEIVKKAHEDYEIKFPNHSKLKEKEIGAVFYISDDTKEILDEMHDNLGIIRRSNLEYFEDIEVYIERWNEAAKNGQEYDPRSDPRLFFICNQMRRQMMNKYQVNFEKLRTSLLKDLSSLPTFNE